MTELSFEEIAKAFDIGSAFKDRKEKAAANVLLRKYLLEFSPESISDKNNLRSLIYLEIIQRRMQDQMNELQDSDAATPLKMVETIHKNLNEIANVKERLGLVGKEREAAKTDAYKALDTLKVKFRKWRKANQGSRTLTCPHCGKMTMLKIRMDAWEAQGHPFFRDRFLANEHLVRMYQEGRISKEDVAKTLESANDYVDWLIAKWQTKEESSGEIEGHEEREEETESGQEPIKEEEKEIEVVSMSQARRLSVQKDIPIERFVLKNDKETKEETDAHE